MTNLWGIHNDRGELDPVADGFISIGWDDLGDLTSVVQDKKLLRERIAQTYPDAKPGAIPVWAGVIRRFVLEMGEGDIVVCPRKADSTIGLGRVAGPFYADPNAGLYRNRRPITWIKTGIPRAEFSQSARYEIGSAVTLFRVKNHADEFLARVHGAAPIPTPSAQEDEAAAEQVEDEPTADRVEGYTRDFVIDVLRKLDPYRFEDFVAAVLRSLGYRAQPTQASGDGGVDVIAYRDPLGFEPPIIKVQCKRMVSTIGGPGIQQLVGTLAQGGHEVGLFVTLGSYSSDALHIERTRQDLRLISGPDLVDMIFDGYERLDPEWRALLPMRRLYVVDRSAEIG